MAFQLANTGTFDDLFDDLETLLGTTLSWTLFDDVGVNEKIYTIPVTTGGYSPAINPSFIRLFRDTVAFSVRLTLYDSWQVGMGVGGATNPIPAADAINKNILDFSSAITTVAYRLYGDASEGYVAVLNDGTGGVGLPGFWIGVLEGRATPAAHPNPNAILYKTTTGAAVACDFLNLNLTQINETAAEFFDFNLWSNSTEQHSGLSPIVSAFAWRGQSGVSEIAGIAKDFFQCTGNLDFGDTITIFTAVHRVIRGGGYCILE